MAAHITRPPLMGSNALSRLQRDALSKPGISSSLVLLGINDIAWPGTPFAPETSLPNIEQLTAGFTQLVKQAHMQGVSMIDATIPPFQGTLEGTPITHYYSDEKNQLRLALNEWIKTSQAFDNVIDFDSILRYANALNHIAPEYDSGDYIHPGEAGNKEMAYGFELNVLNNALSRSKNSPQNW